MGLTVYYDWKAKSDVRSARRLIRRFRGISLKLPFDSVSEVYEQNAPEGTFEFREYEGKFPTGGLHLPRKRADGEEEVVRVPALHAMFFYVNVQGAESASIGLASHPPVVIHREDVIEHNEKGSETRRTFGQGQPIEFATRRRGYYSWHSFCKTQYAGNPKLGGEANFLRAHLSLIELLDQIRGMDVTVRIRDDSKYAKHRDVNRLLQSLGEWNSIVASFVGRLGDALGEGAGTVIAPIQDRPDFEHLEAKGLDVLKKLANRQRRRKKP